MDLLAPTSPHRHAGTSVRGSMLRVLYALIPGMVAYVWFFGWGVVINVLLASIAAVTAEAAMLAARGRPVMPVIADGSAVVTAALLAVALPPVAPWWVTLVATGFAIVIAKHLYGGLGFNPFNPAMAGYVLVLISFPKEMTVWPAAASVSGHYPGLWDSLQLIFGGTPGGLDAYTGATPLDLMKTQLGLNLTVSEIRASPVFGDFGGKGWEWLGNGFLLGGLWLAYKRVAAWQIPVGMLASLLVISLLFYAVDPGSHASPLFHLFSGGAMLGAFFIATDPVTAATTPRGRLIYGSGVGLLTYVIRTWGGYPDGVAFAVLLMNLAAPTIDYYTQPRVFGHSRS